MPAIMSSYALRQAFRERPTDKLALVITRRRRESATSLRDIGGNAERHQPFPDARRVPSVVLRTWRQCNVVPHRHKSMAVYAV